MKISSKIAALLATPLIALGAGSADASHIFVGDLGANNVLVYDNETGDTSPLLGSVLATNVLFGAWNINVSIGDGLPSAGSNVQPDTHLNVFGSSSSAASLFVVWYDYGDNRSGLGQYLAGTYDWLADGSVQVPAGATVTWGACASDQLFAGCNWSFGGTPIDQTGLLFSRNSGGIETGTGTFAGNWSTAIFAFITLPSAGNFSIDLDLTTVPEPGSLALLGLGLLGLGSMRRRISA